MVIPCGHKDHIPRLERLALAVVLEQTRSTGDEVDLIPVVRLLQIDLVRLADLDLERAMMEQADEVCLVTWL